MFIFGATSAVLLPARLAELTPDGKVAALGVLTVVGGVIALVANIVFGAMSDRTRGRFGRRNPWILGAAVMTALALNLVPLATSVVTLILLWCVVQIFMNAHIAALVATVPDRVPVARRGTVSSVYGVGMVLGSVVGQVAGASFIEDTGTGFRFVGFAIVLAAVVFVVLAPEPPATQARTPRESWRSLVAFPRGAPDFTWALWGRLLLMLGYFSVAAYQLYILTDYVGLDDTEAAAAIVAIGVTAALASLIGAGVAGPLSDRLGRRKMPVIVSSLLIGGAMLLPFASASVGALIGTAAVAGLGFGIYLAVDTALMTEVLPSEDDRAKDMGILNIANTAGQILAPGVASITVSIGGYRPLFVVGLLIACASALCIRPIKGVR
jgi:MFS family permease